MIYSRRSQSDIAEIFNYIATQDYSIALAVEADIKKACEGLARFPYANASTQRADVFRMPVRKRGFTVFYRVRPRLSVVEIVRVVRGARVKALGRVPT